MAMEMQTPKDVEPSSLSEKRFENPCPSATAAATEDPKELKPPLAEIVSDSSSSPSSAPVSDLQKKFHRAERFGVPLQLSEKEKRNSRAERFGTGSTCNKSEETGKSEEQKRKARAERFGLNVSSSVDEDVKKKARLARFAPNSKTDSLEEDKRQARAIRFSHTSLDTQANGKSNDLVETEGFMPMVLFEYTTPDDLNLCEFRDAILQDDADGSSSDMEIL